MPRVRVGLAVVIAVAAASAAIGPSAASASSCPQAIYGSSPTNRGSTACLFNLQAQYGTYTEFKNVSLTVPSSPNHNFLANGLWSYSTCAEDTWVEQGYSRGDGITGGTAYHFYWAANDPYSGFYEGLSSASADNLNRAYRNVFQGVYYTGIYDIIRNGVTVKSVGLQGTGGTCVSQSGMEAGNPNGGGNLLAGQTSSTFANSPLAWQDTSYAYHYGWNTADYWIDNGCYNPPSSNCLNGIFYGSSNWSDNKK